MISKKPLKLSFIIPVYNEERNLKACLDAIAAQTVKPYEVIFVDNNSTDNSMTIARKYRFVKIVKEPKQGIVAARNKGFLTAKGDIFARIDADSIIPIDWVEKVIETFEKDKNIDAVTGYGCTYAGITNYRLNIFGSWLLFALSKAYYGTDVIWGSNSAMRASTTKACLKYCHNNDNFVHEDTDLAMAFVGRGAKIKILKNITVDVDYGDIHYFPKFFRYLKMHIYTKKRNAANLRKCNKKYSVIYRPVILLVTSYFIPIALFYTALNSIYINILLFKRNLLYGRD